MRKLLALCVLVHVATSAEWSMPSGFGLRLVRNIYFVDLHICIKKAGQPVVKPAESLQLAIAKCPRPPVNDPMASALKHLVEAGKGWSTNCKKRYILCGVYLLEDVLVLIGEGLNMLSLPLGSAYQFEEPFIACAWPHLRQLYCPLTQAFHDIIACVNLVTDENG